MSLIFFVFYKRPDFYGTSLLYWSKCSYQRRQSKLSVYDVLHAIFFFLIISKSCTFAIWHLQLVLAINGTIIFCWHALTFSTFCVPIKNQLNQLNQLASRTNQHWQQCFQFQEKFPAFARMRAANRVVIVFSVHFVCLCATLKP